MLGGVLTAIVTPFREDGSVDFDAFQRLARHLCDNGSDGVVVAGTTGESPTLADDERLDLIRAAFEAVGDTHTVIAGTGTYSTAHSVYLTERAHQLGAHAFLIVTPYYNKPPQRGIVAHFEAIARVSDRPIVVYNIPSRVAINIDRDGARARRGRDRPGRSRQRRSRRRRGTSSSLASPPLRAGDDAPIQPSSGWCHRWRRRHPTVGPRRPVRSAARRWRLERAGQIDADPAPAYDLMRVQIN